MKKRFSFLVAMLFALLAIPLSVAASENTSRDGQPLQKFEIENIVDVTKPFKTEDGEFVDIMEHFNSQPSFIAPRIIIGPDGRHKVADPSVMPYRAMTYIILEYNNFVSSCSGTIVDNYKVLTNAHCVVDKDTKETPKKITVFTQMQDNNYVHSYKAVSSHYPSTYNGNTDVDYAVILLDQTSSTVPGIANGKTPIKTVTNLTNNQALKVYGYPGDKSPVSLWGMSGNLESQTSTIAYYNMDTYSGQSGSGVLNTSNELVAVHAAGFSTTSGLRYNGGPKMTSTAVNFINSFN
ncbi:hypothetical protein GCM10007425_30270 [Lysinibacillus alkalisoli]|uniref:Serine protease n=1 Tax=Lysinibacillus alkalisoli TaxID=1911548 RepID=A0A917GA83_9BACI|nr:trypsin-like peptidase domain-containing protein [Lysinibacillus alkalisoli]GGG33526.1 hypothetical protein GCM10007425_30270 [Lysinibacillus alkalisoli]